MTQIKNDLKLFGDIYKENSSILSVLRKDIYFLKQFFNINEADFEDFIPKFTSFVKEKAKNPQYIIYIIEYFCKIRFKYIKYVPKLIFILNSVVININQQIPEIVWKKCQFNKLILDAIINSQNKSVSTNQIQLNETVPIFLKKKNDREILPQIVLFQDGSILEIIENDDFDRFMNYHDRDTNWNITKIQTTNTILQILHFAYSPDEISIIDIAAFFGATKIFKYLFINNFKITDDTCNFAVCGGENEIIQMLNQNGFSFAKCLTASIKYHRYMISDWILSNFECEDPFITECINSYHYESFIFYMIRGTQIDKIYPNNQSVLHIATMNCMIPLVQYLINNQLVSSEYTDELLETPIHKASENGCLQLVQFLYKKAPLCKDSKNLKGNTPLHIACENGNVNVVKFLIDQGKCNKEVQNKEGMTPFLISCAAGSIPLLQYLISKAKVNLNATTFSGENALIIAYSFNKYNVIKYLIQKCGINKNSKDLNGNTLLHFAASQCNIEIINYLLKIGAKKYVKNNNGETPYDVIGKLNKNIIYEDTILLKSLLQYTRNEEMELSQEIYPFIAMRNFRELGGYKSFDKRAIKHNVFFRGPKLSLIHSKEEENTFKKFGIKTVIDFRMPSEYIKNKDPKYEGITYYEIPSKTSQDKPIKTINDLEDVILLIRESYTDIPFDNAAFKTLFNEIIQGNTPIYFHCASGKDRTGIAAALILSLFGVAMEDILYDYEISNQHLAVKIENIVESKANTYSSPKADALLRELNGVRKENLQSTFDSILRKYKSMDEYFEKEYGITSDIKKMLFDRYLV